MGPCFLLVEPHPHLLGYTALKSRIKYSYTIVYLWTMNVKWYFIFIRLFFNCYFIIAVKLNWLIIGCCERRQLKKISTSVGIWTQIACFARIHCLCCLLSEDWDHLHVQWHMLNYFTEVSFQISFFMYVIIKTCLLVWNCLCAVDFAIAVSQLSTVVYEKHLFC